MEEFPFYDGAWVKENFPRIKHDRAINYRDAYLEFFRTWLPKIPAERTIVQDSLSAVERNFFMASEIWRDRYMTKGDPSKGIPPTFDKFKLFDHWKMYISEISAILQSHTGHSVTICHFYVERNEDGVIIGIRPSILGQMADKLAGDFTHALQAYKNSKNTPPTFHIATVSSQANIVLPPGISPAPGDGLIEPSFEAILNLPKRVLKGVTA